MVFQDRLIALVAGFLLDVNSSDRLASMDEDYRANTHQNIADAIAQLPKLATGVDVNVSFQDIRGFEFTQDTVIFDLLDVRLLHGWLVDPKVNCYSHPVHVPKLMQYLFEGRLSAPLQVRDEFH